MTSIVVTPFSNSIHRHEVVTLWKTVFNYQDAHNQPELCIDKKLAVNDDLFFVAIADKKVVGTIMAGYDGHRGWIYSMAVSPSHRRQKIGSQLMTHAERSLIAKGCMKINLQIRGGNEGVAQFYSLLGYSIEKNISMGKRVPENIPGA